MANTKISALTSATTPLGGTEVLPIVQSNTTVKVSVANLTAGRAISASSLSLTTALTTANGGTGLSSFTAGDMLYYASGSTLTALGIGAANRVLTSTGSAPQWATSLALGGSLSVASTTLIGTTSTSGITGNGLSVNSGSVGTDGTTCAVSIYGSGGDFYARNYRASTGAVFYDLVVFSAGTPYVYTAYRNSSGTVQGITQAYSNGSFQVIGALSKGSGSFRIEHPHPELSATHELVHSFIEGPQADLIYRGQVELQNGRAEVNIDQAANMKDGTFVLLCRDVQCFTSNETDWDNVRGKVNGNILTIESQNPTSNSTISWMVVGERQDKHIMDTDWTDNNGKVIVEPLKRAKPEIEG